MVLFLLTASERNVSKKYSTHQSYYVLLADNSNHQYLVQQVPPKIPSTAITTNISISVSAE
jgi:hypothetical protein